MAPAFDDEDLSISLPASNNRRAQKKPPDASGTHARHGVPAKNPDPPTQTRSTQRLGQYTIIKTLGEGSFGKVKLAVHQVSGQKVALKIISRRKLISRDMAGRVEREIQYTVITTTTEIIMVLEYAGGELFDYIVQHGKMAEESARRFFQQIICAVEYCHRHKIVHRDLKPENLLLDEYLNVKIADFGLSNIMTDGNFLKTSCGSPNYAAPEVISGKLYAGPEVDVWSCGVILYVLLVGRLPFDDEYIPTLFKKIAQGNYTVPNYLSSGAVNLIRKMLVVNPVHRITVQEIRQDRWFMKNLPEYLQPPVEEFIDTGVDPNKAINPRTLAPGKPPAVQEKLHEAVVGKLGKTMGYAKDDVQEALGKDEPSAIKDAYLIVRENQIMKANPHLANDQGLQPFLAQSPPAWNGGTAMSPMQPHNSPRLPATHTATPVTRDVAKPAAEAGTSTAKEGSDTDQYISNVGILPSSTPGYHLAFMAGRPASTNNSPSDSAWNEGEPRERSSEEQAATARRLKPHSRSQLNLDKAAHKPEGLTPLPAKKPRQTKWQFGIRSRNQPLEAMACIYRALQKLGAEWEIENPSHGSQNPDDTTEAQRAQADKHGDDSSQERSSGRSRSHHSNHHSRDRSSSESDHSLKRQGSRHRSASGHEERPKDDGYLPEDPWVLHCRWLKDGMYPPGTVHPSSTHSSTVNLSNAELARRRSSTIGSVSSAAGSLSSQSGSLTQSVPAMSQNLTSHPEPDDGAYIYMEIQLYQLEKEYFLVDFKCAGYERMLQVEVEADEAGSKTASGPGSSSDLTKVSAKLEEHSDMLDLRSSKGSGAALHHLHKLERKLKKQMRGAGRHAGEKEVSSPFPFLDLASKLIIALADAN
ncbi:MAG: Protein kinase [Caeruleum heppii]|nr:MAG: Protein kinase [Caeruleum heppii]KAI9673647.1 MAG: Protein kinase [Caeruleum heppii]